MTSVRWQFVDRDFSGSECDLCKKSTAYYISIPEPHEKKEKICENCFHENYCLPIAREIGQKGLFIEKCNCSKRERLDFRKN